jgi:hypothetical protein
MLIKKKLRREKINSCNQATPKKFHKMDPFIFDVK